MNKLMRMALWLYFAVGMPIAMVACTSCNNNDNEEMETTINLQNSSASAQDNGNRDFTIGNVNFKMIFVGKGTFTMGSNDANVQFSESPAHQVTLTKDYLIGETEVTEALWNAVMGNNGGSSTLPKTSVTWSQAHNFIDKLNEIAHSQGLISDEERFRLPTEAQWEFAAKGGNQSKGYLYSGSNNIDDVAVTRENSGSDSPIQVKSKKPNELGIYDMSGNAYEWVDDYGGSYSSEPQTDPQNTNGSNYVKRGGSNYHRFSSEPYLFTTTGRYFYGSTDWTIGFRIALEINSNSTNISDAAQDKLAMNCPKYNMQGQIISEDNYKGIYIQDGKKYLKR